VRGFKPLPVLVLHMNFIKKFFGRKTVSESPWKYFEGKGNSDEILLQKAVAFSTIIVDWSGTGAKMLLEDITDVEAEKKVLKNKFSHVLLEMIMLFVCYTERIACTQEFSVLSRGQCRLFIQLLIKYIERVLLKEDADENSRKNYHVLFEVNLQVRRKQYGKYRIDKLLPDESLSGSLFYEFGKTIAKDLGREDDLVAITTTSFIVMNTLKYFRIPDLLRE